jgi:peptide/nickel transport system substrate-binding protein
MSLLRFLRQALLCAAVAAAGAAHAASLRVASAFDPQTMDPQALALLYHSRIVFQLYESLVTRDEKFGLEPGLAVSWQPAGPLAWRFKLRPNVVFHDGTPFTADDAVFSIERALGPTSQRAFQLKGVTAVKKIDALTIELQLEQPDAVLPEKTQFIAMMSKAWCEKHGVQKAQDFNGKQETFAVRNANGTGPFKLKRYEPDVRTVLERHAGWWGWGDKRHGNLEEISFTSIKADATRLAALASGEVDLVLDPPFQDVERLKRDPRLAVTSIADIGQL